MKAPMAHTSRAKDYLEPDNPFNVGMTGVFGSKAGFHAVTSCDTLVLLGCDFAWRQFYPKDARVIQIDLDATHLGRRHPVEIGVVGDIAATLDALQPRLKPRSDRGYLDQCLELFRDALADLDHQAKPGRAGLIHPQREELPGAAINAPATYVFGGLCWNTALPLGYGNHRHHHRDEQKGQDDDLFETNVAAAAAAPQLQDRWTKMAFFKK